MKPKKGLAALSPERRREIASMGGKATAGKNLTVEGRVKGGKVSKRGKAKA